MSELTVLFFAILFKSICVCVAIVCAYLLMQQGKDGWGWFVFLAVILASTSYKYTPDTPVEAEQKK